MGFAEKVPVGGTLRKVCASRSLSRETLPRERCVRTIQRVGKLLQLRPRGACSVYCVRHTDGDQWIPDHCFF